MYSSDVNHMGSKGPYHDLTVLAASAAMLRGSWNSLVLFADGSWAAKVVQQGPSDDLTALAAAAALSVRSTHPISQAVTLLTGQLSSALPQLHLQDFRQESGTACT